MIDDRLLGHGAERLGERAQIRRAPHLGAVRPAEDEVAEAQALLDEAADLPEQAGGVLVDVVDA